MAPNKTVFWKTPNQWKWNRKETRKGMHSMKRDLGSDFCQRCLLMGTMLI